MTDSPVVSRVPPISRLREIGVTERSRPTVSTTPNSLRSIKSRVLSGDHQMLLKGIGVWSSRGETNVVRAVRAHDAARASSVSGLLAEREPLAVG